MVSSKKQTKVIDMEDKAPVSVLLRVPRELHDRVLELMKGGPGRPPSAQQATYLWLLERALDEYDREYGRQRAA